MKKLAFIGLGNMGRAICSGLIAGGAVAVVNEDNCIACGDCLEDCPMGAITDISED